MLFTFSFVSKSIIGFFMLCIFYFDASAQNTSFPLPSPQPIPSPPPQNPTPSDPSPILDPSDPVLIPGIEDVGGIPQTVGIRDNVKQPNRATEEIINRLSMLEKKVSQQAQTIKELENRETLDGLPSGSIIFYDRENCAEGWSKVTQAKGRVLVGAGFYNKGADEDHRNTPYSYELEATGGNIDLILTEKQMPKHQHGTAWGEIWEYAAKYGYVGVARNNYGSSATDKDNYEYLSEPKGDGRPFDNRMPYIAYTVCKKDK